MPPSRETKLATPESNSTKSRRSTHLKNDIIDGREKRQARKPCLVDKAIVTEGGRD